MLKERWPSVRDSGSFNDSKLFATELLNLAEQYNSEPVRQYGQTLMNYAEAYLATNLESLLEVFPHFIKQIEPPE